MTLPFVSFNLMRPVFSDLFNEYRKGNNQKKITFLCTEANQIKRIIKIIQSKISEVRNPIYMFKKVQNNKLLYLTQMEAQKITANET